MTASRILAGGSVRSKNRELVLQSARKLGYVRNQHAANLRTGRSRLIGVMVPFIDNPFYTKFLQEMHDALAEKKYQSLIACSFGQSGSMLAAVDLFRTYHVDGIVLDISEGIVTDDVRRRLAAFQRSHSIVITGAQRHNIPHDHLYLDNRRAIADLVAHLLERGHRDLGFLGGLAENQNIRNRLDAFRAELRRAGLALPPEWVSLGPPSLDSVMQRAAAVLRAPRRPTALVCTSDMIGMVAIKTAIETGLRVPEDLAVTGFDDIDQASLINPGLTTVRQPLAAMARDIVDLMLRRIARRRLPMQEKRYAAELVIRGST